LVSADKPIVKFELIAHKNFHMDGTKKLSAASNALSGDSCTENELVFVKITRTWFYPR